MAEESRRQSATTEGRVHIVGAGLAGLAAALSLTRAGYQVSLHEAAGQAGGRCRSYYDERLERQVDNGNHLILACNSATLAYAREVGSLDTLSGPPEATFPFFDLEANKRWVARINKGRVPWWLLSGKRRVPGTWPWQYLELFSLLRAAKAEDDLPLDRWMRPRGRVWEQLWAPLCISALNTEPSAASARLMGNLLRQIFARGGAGARPMVARMGLSAAFVDPALEELQQRGADIHLNDRLRALQFDDMRVTGLEFGDRVVDLGAHERLVLAVPARHAAALLPGLVVPRESRPIVNVHMRLPHRVRLPEGIPFVGVSGGYTQWLFVNEDVASATVSAAVDLVDEPAPDIARLIWSETAKVLSLDPDYRPPIRVVKERRATFAQTPAEVRRRAGTYTAWPNLVLAGDWTNTGLPASIEGAIRSGRAAASAVLRGPAN
ncbi:MAG: hydroxysqualene dehydroxylase HpnE [Rhodovibrionaceae bacterium]|nr:hydroxysqualene dehydroxylase HpnE [Rhodovibrionaceae bacterium]